MYGFQTQNKLKKLEDEGKEEKNQENHLKMFCRWSEAVGHLMNQETQEQTTQQLYEIARVLHGHTWTSIIGQSTEDLIE